jgi:hypothetical protein
MTVCEGDSIVLLDSYTCTVHTLIGLLNQSIGSVVNISVLIVAASAPTTREDTTALVVGDKWYNTTNQLTYLWSGTTWVVIPTLVILKELYTTVGVVTAGTPVVIPNSVEYVIGDNSLKVSINGIEQYLDGGSYVEADTSYVTFTEDLPLGTQILFTITIMY